jgi:hypothetical protein
MGTDEVTQEIEMWRELKEHRTLDPGFNFSMSEERVNGYAIVSGISGAGSMALVAIIEEQL